jgi:hypothetical protein
MGDHNITYFISVPSSGILLMLNASNLPATISDFETVLIKTAAPDPKLVCSDTSLF